MMNNLRILFVLQVIAVTSEYAVRCPVAAEWRFRGKKFNCGDTQYVCLFRSPGDTYHETCNGLDYSSTGSKLIYEPYFNKALCSINRYQPFPFSTDGNSKCVFQKSFCNEKGQYAFQTGTLKSDTTCGCDLSRGYEFATKPRNNCYCIPSEEDCSCHKLPCNEKDKQCPSDSDEVLARSLAENHMLTTLVIDQFNNADDEYNGKTHRLQCLYITTVLLIFMTSVVSLYIMVCKKIHRLKEINRQHIQMNQNEIIYKRSFEQFEKQFEQWKKDDDKFVGTALEKKLMKTVLKQSSITLVGNSGVGKTFLLRHIALKMSKHGYTVIPCSQARDISFFYKHGRKTLFVFNDVCGRYTLDQQEYTDWKQRLDDIRSLLEDKYCKILSTFRLDVYKDKQCSNLSIFKMCNVDLSSKDYRISDAEKIALAEVYFKVNTDEVKELSATYECFPLLCSLYYKQKLQDHVSVKSFFSNPFAVFENQVQQMISEGDNGKLKYCSLVLCVMFNNTLTEENLSIKDIDTVIKASLTECELNKETSTKSLRKSLETLEGTYVVTEDTTYKIIHEKLFDFLAKYFGEKMLQLFIDHAETAFIHERFLMKTAYLTGTEIEFSITIPDNYVNSYIERLLKDWLNGFIYRVFHNRNMNDTKFTNTLVSSLNKLDQRKQLELVCTQDNHNKYTALAGSCFIGNVDLVGWLISKHRDINHRTVDGCSPLFWASQEGHVNVVKKLLQYSPNINQCDNDGASPLYVSSRNGHINVVKELLQNLADIKKCNNNGVSPLLIASQEGHVGIVKELVKFSANVNQCDNNDASPLYVSSQNGHVNVVKELLPNSADVSIRHKNGVSPLCIASHNGHVDVVNELLQHSADVNQCNSKGMSPLYITSKEGHVDVVTKLLEYSADANQCCYDCSSPLYTANQEGHVNVVKELLHHSAMVNHCNSKGMSPLYIASQEGHVKVVQELLQHFAEVNQCKHKGISPLYIASEKGHVDVVSKLFEYSADVNQCCYDGSSPLYISSQEGHVNVVKELLKHSAIVNKSNSKGMSPLYIASQEGHVNVVKELLQHSADVYQCKHMGASPLYVARQNEHVDIVKELLQKIAEAENFYNDDASASCVASHEEHGNIVC
ncbi:uncharacterized protein LOC127712610 [Mytilus californianus]|uniref:uncharacterized protein LOC127712610 n=1 Tax=Mytilus californianus TaxID=6549 RepID=UPI00224528A6|nr:uncharacterized protein LOC127712610 [Mytilus californianus]